MANAPQVDFNGDVIHVWKDTVSASTKILQDDNEVISIQAVHWIGITTAGHKMELTDGAGRTIFKLTADAPGPSGNLSYNAEVPFCIRTKGLRVVDLDSGELLIFKYQP